MTFEQIVSELRYTTEVEKTLLHSFLNNEKTVKSIAQTAYCGENFDFPLCKHMPLIRLTVVTYLLVKKYDDYKTLGIPDDIIFDTFRDVSLRANLFYNKYSKAGVSKEDVVWFRHIMNVGIFKIGSLQYQPFDMIYLDEETIGQPYMTFKEEQKEALPQGAPVLNCHIQQGADLTSPALDVSFREAKKFFSEHFPAVPYRAFLCYSWLLYSPMLRYLSDQSNIKQFASRFSIIGLCQDPEQATENLFGHQTGKDCSPNPTSLQKLAAEHLELFGFACGVIPI